MSLIASKNIPSEPRTHLSTLAFDNIVIQYRDDVTYASTSVLVIPHNLVKQWIQYFNDVAPLLRTFLISTTKQLMAFSEQDVVNIEQHDVIIVSSSFYNHFVHLTKDKGIKFNRLIFDEVDNIPLKSCEPCKARFIWFVTASTKNLMHPRGHGIWDQRAHRFVHIAEGIKSTGYIRSLFMHMVPALTQLIVVKNKDEYVDSSMQLPELEQYIVKCLTPRTIQILDGIVDNNILAALNANDIDGAIQHINPTHRAPEDHIITILLEKYTRILQNAKTMLRMVNEELIYESESAREHDAQRHKKIIEEYEIKVGHIESRIKTTNTCCICYDNITNKTIVDCCKNAFCFKCISLWLGSRNNNYTLHSCPSCRKQIGTDNMYVVRSETDNQEELINKQTFIDGVMVRLMIK
jgi:hypothetical protein